MFSGYMWHGKYFSASCTNKKELFTFVFVKKKKGKVLATVFSTCPNAQLCKFEQAELSAVNLNKQNSQQ